MKTTISNPPYNLKWQHPFFSQAQPRFSHVTPPEGNANFVFVLSALEESDRCVFLLPTGVLTSKNEKPIRQYLVETNLLEAIITLPTDMFEDTGVATSILVLDKNKKTSTIELIDLRDKCAKEAREQKGQFGGKSHTNRVYKKEYYVINDELIEDVLTCIDERKTIKEYCISLTIEQIKEKNFSLQPSMYFEVSFKDCFTEHRSFDDIIEDLNRVIKEKNTCKLTINETLAKNIGFDLELYKSDKTSIDEINKNLEIFNIKKRLVKSDYFSTTKNKNEVKFENNSKEQVSSIFMLIFNMWKQHIYYLNLEENRYLVELRDALLPDLMSGKLTPKETRK